MRRSYIFDPVCPRTPCNAQLAPGTHVLALSQPGGALVEAEDPLTVTSPSTVSGTYDDRSGMRSLGWGLFFVSLIAGTGMFVVGTTSDPQEGFANPVAIAGAVVGIVGPLASMALILQKDSVSFSLAPLAVGALPGRKEGAAAPPTGLALTMTF
jgi:hypothetical protein